MSSAPDRYGQAFVRWSSVFLPVSLAGAGYQVAFFFKCVRDGTEQTAMSNRCHHHHHPLTCLRFLRGSLGLHLLPRHLRLSEQRLQRRCTFAVLRYFGMVVRFPLEGPSLRRTIVCGRMPQDPSLLRSFSRCFPRRLPLPILLQACAVLYKKAKLHQQTMQLLVRRLQCHQIQS